MARSEETVTLQSNAEYREVTVKLWGKGVVLRATVTGAAIAASRRFLARSGQFILSRIDARNGATGIVPQELDGAVVTNDFPLFNLDPDRVDSRFIGWLTKTKTFVELCLRASEGTTNRVRLQEDLFLSLKLPLPPLPEQQRLVARIEGLASLVKEASTLRQRASEQAEALVISLHAHIAGKRTRTLGQMLMLDEHSVPVSPTGSYPQVGVKSFGGGLFRKGAVAGTATTYRAFNRLYEGAVLLSQVKGWEGAVAVCPSKMAGWFVSPEYRTFRCIPAEARPRYLASIVRTEWFWSKLANATRGAGARRERTRPEQFLQVELPMPDVEQQKRAERPLAEVDALTRLQAETAAQLEALLPAILDKAFKGEL
jgi:type I restriction enzyme S subunit